MVRKRIPKKRYLECIYEKFNEQKRRNIFGNEHFMFLPNIQLLQYPPEKTLIMSIRNKALPIYLQKKNKHPNDLLNIKINSNTNSKIIEFLYNQLQKNEHRINNIPRPLTDKQKQEASNLLLDRIDILI